MAEFVEVVFEKAAEKRIFQLLTLLINNSGQVMDWECSENIILFEEGRLSEAALNKIFDFGGDIGLSINVHSMRLDRVILPEVMIRLVKYGNEYDVEFSFDRDGVESFDPLIADLHAFAMEVGANFDMAAYYAGMEPASDEETRYFTNNELGPLKALG